MSNNGFFITGTDTGVGKTLVSCSLIHKLQQQGHRVVGMKPVAAGAEPTEDGLRNEDALQMITASNTSLSYEAINPYCYQSPIAPHIAADEEKRPIEISVLLERYQDLKQQADCVIVEGAGGWLVPINENETLANLAVALQLPVILVVGIRLGCLNHALLSQAAIEQSGLPLAGWVANIIDPTNTKVNQNIDYLKNSLKCPHLGTLPYQTNPDARELAESLSLEY